MKVVLNLIPIVVIVLLALPTALFLNMLDWTRDRGDRLSWRLLRARVDRPTKKTITEHCLEGLRTRQTDYHGQRQHHHRRGRR